MREESEDRSLQVVYYRAGGEMRELDKEDRKQNEDCSPDSQASEASWFPGRECFWVLEAEEKGWGERGRKAIGDLCSPLGIEAERNRRPKKEVCYKTGDKTGAWDWSI